MERERKEVAQKELRIDVKQSRARTSSPLKRIDNASKTPFTDLTNSTNKNKSIKTHHIKPKNRFQLPTVTSNLPKPSNGIEYTPPEVIAIISPFPRNSNARSKIIKHFIHESLVPVNKTALYNLLKKHEMNKIVRNKWHDLGPPRLLQENDISDIADSLTKKNGATIGIDDIRNKISAIPWTITRGSATFRNCIEK